MENATFDSTFSSIAASIVMLISVVTVSLNSSGTIEDTICSVLSQQHVDLEYIVVDGGSIDGTNSIVKKYASRLQYISEKDEGIYDAINKGVRIAKGDIVAILNSDDFYVDSKVLERVSVAFAHNDVEIVYGNINYVKRFDTKNIIRHWDAQRGDNDSFYTGWHPPHPALFVTRNVYEKYGNYNTRFKIAADYEFMIRIFEKHKLKSYHIEEVLVSMRIGGVSNNSLKNIIISNYECYMAWKSNDIQISLNQLMARPFSKLKQFLKQPCE